MVVSSFMKPKKEARDEKETKSTQKTDYEYQVVDGNEDSDTSILVIPIQGVILSERSSDLGFFDFLGEEGVTYGDEVKESLKRAAEDNSIRAILLEINSPGGTIPGAKAITDGVRYYRNSTKHPVYAHITDMGASGGYWAAASTDYIVSEIGSTVGSIGVIMGPFKYYDGLVSEQDFFGGVQTENGITNRYFSAGQYKDTGSPYRKLTEEEERHWQTSLNNEYARFVDYVSQQRGIERDTIINTIKALPYETTRALQLRLIDAEGSQEEALELLAKQAGISDYSVLQESPSFGFFEELFGSVATLVPHKQIRSCQWCNAPLYMYDRSYTLGM